MHTRSSWTTFLVFLMLSSAFVAMGCNEGSQITEPATLLTANHGADNANDAATHTYDISVTNLTTGQPLSPGVFLTHVKQQSLFAVGSAASEGIRLIAENGDPSMAATDVTGQPGIFDVQTSGVPIHRIGGPGASTVTVRITARADANRFSFAAMLICTNDGFTGLEGVKLPGGFSAATYYAMAYDAGTELNDEDAGSIVPPCFGIGPVSGPSGGPARTPTSDAITPHAGIQGGADLDPAQHGWTEPVARITIQRID